MWDLSLIHKKNYKMNYTKKNYTNLLKKLYTYICTRKKKSNLSTFSCIWSCPKNCAPTTRVPHTCVFGFEIPSKRTFPPSLDPSHSSDTQRVEKHVPEHEVDEVLVPDPPVPPLGLQRRPSVVNPVVAPVVEMPRVGHVEIVYDPTKQAILLKLVHHYSIEDLHFVRVESHRTSVAPRGHGGPVDDLRGPQPPLPHALYYLWPKLSCEVSTVDETTDARPVYAVVQTGVHDYRVGHGFLGEVILQLLSVPFVCQWVQPLIVACMVPMPVENRGETDALRCVSRIRYVHIKQSWDDGDFSHAHIQDEMQHVTDRVTMVRVSPPEDPPPVQAAPRLLARVELERAVSRVHPTVALQCPQRTFTPRILAREAWV